MKQAWILLIAGAVLAGCDAQKNASDAGMESDGEKLTVGKVQREIAKGMSGSQVAEALGTPNIVTTDETGREVWVYDRYASDVRYSQSSGGVWVVFAFIGGNTGATSKSQRSLTVVIKFDEGKKVREVAYHAMQF